jgi:hypothetical protein
MADASARPIPLAAAASIGAGIVHVAGSVAEHDRASVALALGGLGVAQIGWGAWAIDHPRDRRSLLVGAGVSIVAVVGWLAVVTVGVPWPRAWSDGVDPAVPDAIAALLATAVLALTARQLLAGSSAAPGARLATPVGVAAVALLALGAVAAVPSALDQRRDDEGRVASARADADAAAALLADAASTTVPTAVRSTPGPYDPAVPLDLSGIAGTSPAQQRAAEGLVADVLAAEARYPSYDEAGAAGYRSIGDAFTGEEHLIDWSAVLDPATLDPAHPEGLVFDVGDDGARTLAAVMFVLPPGTRATDAPRPGGDLTTWHLHGELCVDPNATPPAVVATTDATGECGPGLVEPQPAPTLHVWVVRHPCGPFSELEGVGADPAAVAGGCEHRHG